MDDAADDSFEEISFFLFSFIFVLEVYIYRERDISLTKIWRKFRNELSFYYSLWNKQNSNLVRWNYLEDGV